MSEEFRWKDVENELIFADFYATTVFNLPVNEVVDECNRLREATPESTVRSNRFGWQSIYQRNKLKGYKALNYLEDLVRDFSNDFIHRFNVVEPSFSVTETEWWVNINSRNSYNVIHEHGRADLIGIYYAQCPPDSGTLVINRNDGSCYTQLYKGGTSPECARAFEVEAVAGRFYLFPGHVWHHVNEHLPDTERISLSYNIHLQGF